MSNRDSPQKLAMDAKLAQVWSRPIDVPAPASTISYSVKLSPDQIQPLVAEGHEIARRVFRSLRQP